MKLNPRLLVLALALGMTVPLTAFATNGYFAHGYGTKSKGLAGGGVALPQDAMAAATNPAGMVFVGKRMDVGAAIFSPSTRSYTTSQGLLGGSGLPDGTDCFATFGGACPFTIEAASIDSDNDFFLIPHFAYNWMLNDKSSLGITLYGNGGMDTEYIGNTASFGGAPGGLAGTSITLPGTYGGGTTAMNLSQLFINTTYARKFTDTASWGVSAIVAYQRFKADGLRNFGAFSSNPLKISNNSRDNSSGLGFKVGIQGKVGSSVTLAGSYQSEIAMSEFDKYAGLFAEQGDFDIPATATVGLAWATSPKSTFTADIQVIFYSDVAAIANPIGGLTDGNCIPSPTGGTGPQCLGANDGAGFGWEDMTIIKLGYQWMSGMDWIWRVGLSNGDQPIPESETLFNIIAPAVIETHITGGFTRNLSKDSELSAAFMYAPTADVQGTSAFDPNQTITLEMSQWEAEVSYGMKF